MAPAYPQDALLSTADFNFSVSSIIPTIFSYLVLPKVHPLYSIKSGTSILFDLMIIFFIFILKYKAFSIPQKIKRSQIECLPSILRPFNPHKLCNYEHFSSRISSHARESISLIRFCWFTLVAPGS